MNRLTYINIKLLLWSKENFSLARKKNAVKVYKMARAAHERRAQAKPQESSASIYPTTALASHISPRLCLRSSLVCCPCNPTNFDGILSIRTSEQTLFARWVVGWTIKEIEIVQTVISKSGCVSITTRLYLWASFSALLSSNLSSSLESELVSELYPSSLVSDSSPSLASSPATAFNFVSSLAFNLVFCS